MPQASLTAWLMQQRVIDQAPAKAARNEDASPTAGPRPRLSTPPSSLDASEDGKHNPAINPPCATKSAVQSSLPPQVEIRRCTKEDLLHLKRLNSLLLPIPYPERFYREIIEDPSTNDITLLATWHDDPARIGQDAGRLIGAVRGRLFARPPTPQHMRANAAQTKDGPMLYLSTLVLLSPYRGHGIATRMLDVLLKRAVEDYSVTSVGAHVWQANVEGLEWYKKRGFREVHSEAGYYRRLQPSGAVVMQRDISVTDLLSK